MRMLKKGIPIKSRGPITRRVRAFKGQEMIRWMRVDLKLPVSDAVKLAQTMKDQSFFARIKDNHLPFSGDATLYRFEV